MAFELYRGIFVILPASLVSVPHLRNANIMGRREYSLSYHFSLSYYLLKLQIISFMAVLDSNRPSFSPTARKQGLPCLVPKNFQDFSSHRIFGHMYGARNVVLKNN